MTTDDMEMTVTGMAKLGACLSPSFSPDGSHLAFVSNISGLPQVWTVAASGGWPTLVTALDDPISEVAWSPDGRWLAFVLAPGGGMNQQLYLVRPDGTNLKRLTAGGRDNNWLGPWSHDGKMLAVASNRDNATGMDVFLIDVDSDEWTLVAKQTGIGRITDISRNHQQIIVNRMIGRGDNNLVLIDRAQGVEHILTPHEGPGTFGGGKFSPDGKIVYLTTNQDRDRTAFGRVSLGDDGVPAAIELLAERDDAELDSIALRDDGRMAALVWNVDGRSELAFVDLEPLKIHDVQQLPSDMIWGPTFSRDGSRLAFAATGATMPWDIWIVHPATNRLEQVTHSPHAGIDLATMVRPELVRFPAYDGLTLSGWLYQPRNVTLPCPVVLSFHGGPEAQERPFINSTYQALLAQGIGVFAPNVRGSSGFGKTFVNLDNRELRFDAIKDIKACVDYVVGRGMADPQRIGIMGGSYGGYMTMVGLTDYPDLFAAGANLFGIVNFETFFEHTEPWMAAISHTEYGDPRTERDLLQRLSPIHRLDRVKAATLVLHGANDTNVPVVEAEQVVEQLKQRGSTVEYVLFPDEGHGFVKISNRIRATMAVVRWFVQHLSGKQVLMEDATQPAG
jgi:dipeptidyl aminopeptidase/acylaminoacyl peptidase